MNARIASLIKLQTGVDALVTGAQKGYDVLCPSRDDAFQVALMVMRQFDADKESGGVTVQVTNEECPEVRVRWER